MDLVADEPRSTGADFVEELKAAGDLDRLFARIDAGEVELTGSDGLIPGLIKAALERGLQAELSDHLGYDKGDPAAALFANSRNGTTPKTMASQVGDVRLDVPRDRDGSFTPRLVPKGSRRLGGLDEMIVSLYAGGMTIRDIEHHLASTIGTELSHETISKITDEVLERRCWPGSGVRWRRSTRSSTSTRSWSRSATARTCATSQRTSRWAWTWTASSTCWGSGSRSTRAPSSGPGSAPSWPTAASATC